MAFDPDDYDEVYETISASDKTQLLRQGWVLLDERFASEGGLADESFAKPWRTWPSATVAVRASGVGPPASNPNPSLRTP